MIEVIIVLAAIGAAAYLLWPLFAGRSGRGRVLLLFPAFLTAFWCRPAAAGPGDPSIGLLLIAVDARRDHLLISEALRIANAGPPRRFDLTVMLPPDAAYLTVQRGLTVPEPVPGGFRDRVALQRGLTEIVYSYALPTGTEQTIVRAFPLAVRRMEVVVRGRGVTLSAPRGRELEALMVGGERLPRWQAPPLAAGQAFAFTLRGLPTSRPWVPAAAAAGFAALLAGGLVISALARAVAPPQTKVEESTPVRRNS